MTHNDWRIVQFLADGFRVKEIAEKVGYGNYRSLRNRLRKLYVKTGAKTPMGLVALGFREGKIA